MHVPYPHICPGCNQVVQRTHRCSGPKKKGQMTKKDWQNIVDVLRAERGRELTDTYVADEIAHALADMFDAKYSNFNKDKFIEAYYTEKR